MYKQILKLADDKKVIKLEKGGYYVFITGGHSVKQTNGFYVRINNLDSKDRIYLYELKWKQRVYENRKKAVRFYKLIIPETNKYEVEFINPGGLKVKNSILFSHPFLKLFSNIIDNKIKGVPISNIEFVIKRDSRVKT